MRLLLLVLGMGWVTMVAAQHNAPENSNMPVSNGALNNASGSAKEVADSLRVIKPTTVAPAVEELSRSRKEDASKPKKAEADRNKAVATEKKEAEAIRREAVESERVPSSVEDMENDSPAVNQTIIMQEQFETNQFKANRQLTRRSASPVEQQNMDAAVGYYTTSLPNTFESHFYTYLAGHYNTDLYPELAAAAAMEPENTAVKKQLAAYHIILRDSTEALPIIADLINEAVVTQGQLLYANDLLTSCEENSTLVVHGFEDMFASYYVQQNNAVRGDMKLVSLDFMQSATYRKLLAEDGYKLPESNVIDTAYLTAFCDLNADKSIQLSMTIPKAYFVPMKTALYPVGLTLRYATLPIDNYTTNYRLWKQDLDFGLVEREEPDRSDSWTSNYLPMLVSLKQQLVTDGKKAEAELVNKTILKIAAKTGKQEKVKSLTK